jgi:hypothetical protein
VGRQGGTYALDRGGEQYVQYEECGRANPAFDQVPPVILATNLVTASAPVVERQTT